MQSSAWKDSCQGLSLEGWGQLMIPFPVSLYCRWQHCESWIYSQSISKACIRVLHFN